MKFLSASQSRAARGLLNWSQPDLAERCGMHVQTISQFEQDAGSPTKRTLQKITETFEQNGVEFLEGEGVRKIQTNIQRLSGTEGFVSLLNDIYEVCTTVGGDVCLFNAKLANWYKWLDPDWFQERAAKLMQYTDNFKMKSGVPEGDTFFPGKAYQTYRWFPKNLIPSNNESLYAYGDRIAFLDFKENDLEILIFRHQKFADGVKALFNIAWDSVGKMPDCGERGELLEQKVLKQK